VAALDASGSERARESRRAVGHLAERDLAALAVAADRDQR
jgi:hypothetical protein